MATPDDHPEPWQLPFLWGDWLGSGLIKGLADFLDSLLGSGAKTAPRPTRRSRYLGRPGSRPGSPRKRSRRIEISEPAQAVPDLPENARELPCDLLLTTGSRSALIFPRGLIDDLCLFQRDGVPAGHEMEFVTRRDDPHDHPDAWQPYGLFRFAHADVLELPELNRDQHLLTRLYRDHGLFKLPPARKFLVGGESGYKLGQGEALTAGHKRAWGSPDKVFKRQASGTLTHACVIRAVRSGLSSMQKISWLESAFVRRPEQGQVVHRYYLTRAREPVLVRDHWAEGKRAYRARPSQEVAQLLDVSGAIARRLAS